MEEEEEIKEQVATNYKRRHSSVMYHNSARSETQRDTHAVLSGGGLENGSEETGGEGEAGHPEDGGWVGRLRPLRKLLHAQNQVPSPRCQRLH